MREKGFAVVLFILGVVAISAAMVGGAFYVKQNQPSVQKKMEPRENTSLSKSNTPESSKNGGSEENSTTSSNLSPAPTPYQTSDGKEDNKSISNVFNVLLNRESVDTSNWEIYDGKYFSFKYPDSWDLKGGVNDYSPDMEIVSMGIKGALGIPGADSGGYLGSFAGSIPSASYCQERNKSLAYKYQTINGKRNGNKCIFTSMKSNNDEFKGYAYLYNFKSDKADMTVSIEVKMREEDNQLEKELDILVKSLEFKEIISSNE